MIFLCACQANDCLNGWAIRHKWSIPWHDTPR